MKLTLETLPNENRARIVFDDIVQVDIPYLKSGCVCCPRLDYQNVRDYCANLQDNEKVLEDFLVKAIMRRVGDVLISMHHYDKNDLGSLRKTCEVLVQEARMEKLGKMIGGIFNETNMDA